MMVFEDPAEEDEGVRCDDDSGLRCRSSGTGARRLPTRLGIAPDPRREGEQQRRRATGSSVSPVWSSSRRAWALFSFLFGPFCNVADLISASFTRENKCLGNELPIDGVSTINSSGSRASSKKQAGKKVHSLLQWSAGRSMDLAAKEEEERSGARARRSELVMLTEKVQLQRLALLLRNNEEPLMRRVIKSEQERVQYLRTVNDSYNLSMRLLDDCTALLDTHERRSAQGVGAPRRLQVARDVHDYVIYGLNMCMQNVRNCCMRVDALRKLRAHYDALAADVGSLAAAEASQYKASMWEYCHSHRSASARSKSSAYSRVLKLEGVDLPELLRRHQLKLGYGSSVKDFEELKDTQKLEVYNSIIVESGRAQIQIPLLSSRKMIAAAKTWAKAVSVFIMAAANLLFDVFTAEHKVEAILRGSLKVMAAVGAFAVDVAVSAAVAKAVASVGLGVFACSLAGFVVGAIAGLIFITVSGRLIDLIFGSPTKVPPVTELKFHTAVMPDGMSLANAIAHRPSSK